MQQPATTADGDGPLVVQRQQWRTMLSDTVRTQHSTGPLRVLDAGCGRGWQLQVDDVDLHLTGIDVDADVLAHRTDVARDLDEAICSDLHNAPLPEQSFDVVYSCFVLEHVRGAEAVLDRLVAATRPGGVLLLLFPDRDSVFGVLTRFSPHRVHVLYRRYVQRHATAGDAAHGPFPTVYDPVISRRGMRRYAAARGLRIEREWAEKSYLHFFGPAAPVVDLALRGIALLSLGRLTARYNNLVYVVRTADVD